MSEGSILFIDAYDSFSNNIIALLESELSLSVETIKIDDPRFVLNDDAFYKFRNGFDAVVAGPGPGHPATPADVGVMGQLWTLPDNYMLPVLGICLAFQSMALAFGGEVERLREPRHGMVTPILHCGRDLFENAGDVEATQYHSLHVILGSPGHLAVKDLWRPWKSCKKLIPLAWDLSDERNGAVLMGARHCHKPFWGVQYHPESICTNKAGHKLITSWWEHVYAWNAMYRPSSIRRKLRINTEQPMARSLPTQTHDLKNAVQWTSFQFQDGIEIVDIANLFRADCGIYQPILLESGLRNGKLVNSETGSTSIIGLPHEDSIHIRYSVKNRRLTVSTATNAIASWKSSVKDALAFLESFVERHKATGGAAGVPFWGGLVGFVSYEAGLESIDVEPAAGTGEHSDIWLVFVERSIVVDHITGLVYVQSILGDDNDWLASTEQRLRQLQVAQKSCVSNSEKAKSGVEVIYGPSEEEYCSKVRTCQDHLRAGSSYELCLTDTTSICNDAEPWQLYLRLRQINPAPFGAYFTASASCPDSSIPPQEAHFLSSSPERFLSWSRDGKCQFRPIKGTVKKGPGMNREKAERILNSPKERAENLMIVDLIRHDLNGVTSARDVEVPKLMSVEEYESVFQLVSVIEGELEGSGIPVLAASLPPGSMTGAPKKRSCELLQEIEEGRTRGLYSGVFGYLDVGGGGDFSVVIRSAFKWNDEEWRIGAGGAVTALSDAAAEWEEMLAKRENVLRAFS